MYQFYYAGKQQLNREEVHEDVSSHYHVEAIRPSMWEEHCLECAAPACYTTCAHYKKRADGRCQRFHDGYHVFFDEKASNHQGTRVTFRKWANMMTIIFPEVLSVDDYHRMFIKNEKLGQHLQGIVNSHLPISFKWNYIRIREYLRRRKLRKGASGNPDAFILHVYNYSDDFHLLIEIYDDHTSVYKTSFSLHHGENLFIRDNLPDVCLQAGHLVKIYPENDLEATLDFYWCDFVKGSPIDAVKPAQKVKCVVWDLDNTIWDGILIETEDPQTLKLNEHILETIKALDERGIIQSIASKNDHDQAWALLEQMGLSDYFLYPQIHWHAKSESMKQIAKSFNIGLDTLCLVDDSIYEREQVHQTLPQVRVYDVQELTSLFSYPEFDVLVTKDSQKRRLMYQAEEQRHRMQEVSNVDGIAFLKRCHIQVHLFIPSTDEEKERCFELLTRTNQLNMSGIKYTRHEYEGILSNSNQTYALSCKDDFGSYGIVGFLQYEVISHELHIREYVMSCRVAGKYIESALFSYLLEKENCQKGHFVIEKTKKNSLLRRTLVGIGFTMLQNSKDTVSFVFDQDLQEKEIVRINSLELNK